MSNGRFSLEHPLLLSHCEWERAKIDVQIEFGNNIDRGHKYQKPPDFTNNNNGSPRITLADYAQTSSN